MITDFTEEQKFTQWWLWLILIALGIMPIFGIYKQIILGEALGNKPIPDLGIIIISAFIFGLIAMFWFVRLKTEINQDEVRINFFPFVKMRVNWKEVKSAKIVDYGFVGYGVRFSRKYGTVYNTNGKNGLALELQNGKKLVIGTQKENELINIIQKVSLQP